ncbi:hypothetical protein SAMN05192575_10960 [Nocardioides alpinus]|nr:hypothetical protein SAMN05192575_10960 [Nocardioides alpinus]
MSRDQMQAEIQKRFEARLAELRSEGRTIYDQQIDPDDTSTDAPELWCIVEVDTDEVVQGHMSNADVDEFVAQHPSWVHVWEVHDRIQDDVREA